MWVLFFGFWFWVFGFWFWVSDFQISNFKFEIWIYGFGFGLSNFQISNFKFEIDCGFWDLKFRIRPLAFAGERLTEFSRGS